MTAFSEQWTPKEINRDCAAPHRTYKRELENRYTAYFEQHSDLAGAHRYKAKNIAAALPPGWGHLADLLSGKSWHRHYLSGGSSQVLAVALLGSAITENGPSWLGEVLDLDPELSSNARSEFEFALDPRTLNESPNVTNVDLLVEDERAVVCIEAKLWEAGFDTCRCGKEDGEKALLEPSEAIAVPAQERAGCSQRVLRRKAYWAAASEVLGLPKRAKGLPCPIAAPYQPVRNIAAARALAKGRSAAFVLFYDERNPYFTRCDSWRGWPRVLEELVRPDSDVLFRARSWQSLLSTGVVPRGVVSWAREKHGLIPARRRGSRRDRFRFLPGVTEKLADYVYALRDPRNGKIFYVGKGAGNRVYQHAVHAQIVDAKEGRRGLKLRTIKEIHAAGLEVGIEILRHNLTDMEAFEAEAVAIDALRAAGLELTNLSGGRGSRAKGWAPLEELRARYAAKPAVFDEGHRIVLIRINRNYRPGLSEADLYRFTREWWRMNPKRRPELAFSVYHGIVRAVFRIEPNSWERHSNGRWRFAGHRDPEMEQQYSWCDVSSLLPDGAQNPIRYVYC